MVSRLRAALHSSIISTKPINYIAFAHISKKLKHRNLMVARTNIIDYLLTRKRINFIQL